MKTRTFSIPEALRARESGFRVFLLHIACHYPFRGHLRVVCGVCCFWLHACTRITLGIPSRRSTSKPLRAQVGGTVSIYKYIDTVAASCTVAPRYTVAPPLACRVPASERRGQVGGSKATLLGSLRSVYLWSP